MTAWRIVFALAWFGSFFLFLKSVASNVIESKKNALLIELLGEIPELDLFKSAEKLGWTLRSRDIDDLKRSEEFEPSAVYLKDNIAIFIYDENQNRRIEIRKIEFK